MRGPTLCGTMAEAVADFPDGASLMIPGFGPGTPHNLMGALFDQGATDLTVIANGIGFGGDDDELKDAGSFIKQDRVTAVIAAFTASTHPSRISPGEQAIRAGKVKAEITPQGTLAERIRAGGSGIPAFFTPAGVGTQVAEGKEVRAFDGRDYLLETALMADYTFVRAWKADRAGNLVYRLAARNFNPIMAMAARTTIVEVEQPILEAGELKPDEVHTPGIYVQRLVQIPPDGIFSVNLVERMALREAAAAAATARA